MKLATEDTEDAEQLTYRLAIERISEVGTLTKSAADWPVFDLA